MFSRNEGSFRSSTMNAASPCGSRYRTCSRSVSQTSIALRQNGHRAGVVAFADAARGAGETVADGVPALILRHVLHEYLLAPRLIERAQVGVEVVRVLIRAPARVDPRDVLVRLERQALRQHRDAPAAFGKRRRLRIDLPS